MADPDPALMADIVAAVAEEFMVDPARLRPDTTPAEVAGWDSISVVMLILRLEARLGVPLDVPRLMHAPDLAAIAALIAARAPGAG